MANNQKRIAIYAIYDPDGILDGYRKYFLEQVRPYFDRLLVVVNGEMTSECREELDLLCDGFLLRENTYGLWGAWRDGIHSITFEELDRYDELFLLNDAQFGPFFPLDDFFEKMEESDADYYGILGQFEVPGVTKNSRGVPFKHGHIMGSVSYFFTIKERLLHSAEFRHFYGRRLEDVPVEACVPDHTEVEHNFYDFVCDAGFRADFYMSRKGFDYSPDHQYNNIMISVVEDRVPFARIKSFACDGVNRGLCANYNQYHRKMLEYIDKHTDYDVNLIWDYLLRTKNLTHIFNQLQLTFPIPRDSLETAYRYQPRIAVIMHIYYGELVDEMAGYRKNFPANTDFYISATDQATARKIEECFADVSCRVTVKPNRGLAESTLWVTYADIVVNNKYEYICFCHDKKGWSDPANGKYLAEAMEFRLRVYDNLFGTEQVVKNIINTFVHNPRMGIVGVPHPYHGDGFLSGISGSYLIKGWSYQKILEFKEMLALPASVDDQVPPVFPYGTMFWFRSDALAQTMKQHPFTYDDFSETHQVRNAFEHGFELTYSLIAQSAGFYYAEVLNTEYARMDLANWKYQYKNIMNSFIVRRRFPKNFNHMKAMVEQSLSVSKRAEELEKGIAWHNENMEQSRLYIEAQDAKITELQNELTAVNMRLAAIDKSLLTRLVRIFKGKNWGR